MKTVKIQNSSSLVSHSNSFAFRNALESCPVALIFACRMIPKIFALDISATVLYFTMVFLKDKPRDSNN